MFQKKLFGISPCVTAQIIIFLESCGGKKLLFSYLRYWWGEKKKKSTVMLLARLKVLRAVFISLHQTTKSRLGYKHIKPLSWVDEVH